MNWRIDGMKKVYYIVGAGLVVGTVAATAVYLLSSKKKKECGSSHDYKDPSEERASADNESSTEFTITQDEPVYEYVKSSAIGSIYSGHKGAATIMSDSIEKIGKNIKVSESTNDEIDGVSAELDRMLSED